MAKHLAKLNIESFRGIKNFRLEDTSDINIIVGDNNSGKTSVLEALMLLRNPGSFPSVLNVVRLRAARSLISMGQIPTFDAFINLFNKDINNPNMKLEVGGEVNNTILNTGIKGELEDVMIDAEEMAKFDSRIRQKMKYGEIIYNPEIPTFIGEQYCTVGKIESVESISYNYYSSQQMRILTREFAVTNFLYVSPIEHYGGEVFDRVIRNENYKNIVIKVLQTFDKDITDLLILRNEHTSMPVEFIKHNKSGIMPLSTYGDGLKKVILLADRIASAQDGVLLIDEIETAIHIRSYQDIFNFVVKACMEFNVQLFATTHNIEALDSILKTQYNDKTSEYDKKQKDLIRVITFRKDEKTGETLSRVMPGSKVFHNRESFDFEVRI